MVKPVALLFVLTASGGPVEPTPPRPPSVPAAPKSPEVPAAPHKAEAATKGGEAGKATGAGKGEGAQAEDGKGEAAGAEKGAGKGGERKSSEKRQARGERGSAPLPPALTGSALRQEMKQAATTEEASGNQGERARLEQLAAEITRAREALKQDTARLEAMLKGGNAGAESRMPIGDPMDPLATSVPAGVAASKEAMREQITIVSKAMQGMKPDQAAAIIARLDRVLASEILRRMKPADAGAVMAAIKPEVAAELATAIAVRRSMVDEGKKEAKK